MRSRFKKGDFSKHRDFCHTCKKSFNEQNKVFCKRSYLGFLPHCKPCYLEKSRAINKKNRTKEKVCNFCKKTFLTSHASKPFCGELCKFESKITRNGAENCSTWEHKKEIWFKNEKLSAKNVYFHLFHNKPIQKKTFISTTCQNEKCMNIKHFIASNKETWGKKCTKCFCDLNENNTTSNGSGKISYICKECQQIKRLSKKIYCKTCKKECINKNQRKKRICSIECRIKSYNIENLTEITNNYYLNNWPIKDICNYYSIPIIKLKNTLNYYNPNRKKDFLCNNCQKEHDNIESEYCSPLCMQEFLLK